MHQKNAKKLIFGGVFRIMVNNLCQILVPLNRLTEPLRELSQKGVNFDWTETCDKSFIKLCSV